MTKLKALGALGTVVGVAMALGPVGARADEPVDLDFVAFATGNAPAVVCYVGTGCAGSTNPGTYTFSTGTAPVTGTPECAFGSVDAPSETVPDAEAGLCTITSSGTFNNIVCGTGTVNGGSTTLAEGTSGSDTYVATYFIAFVGGIGVLESGLPSTGPVPATQIAEGTDTSGVAVGVVQISPEPLTGTIPDTSPNHGVCTTGFSVNAVLVTNA